MGYLFDLGRVQKLFLRSTHVIKQLLFSIVPSIMTFDLTEFWGIFGLWVGVGFNNCFGVYACR